MKRVWIGLVLLGGFSSLQLGCGSPCERATDRISSRYEECDFTFSDNGGSSGATCTDEDAAYLECYANCTDSATCEALHGTDGEGAIDFGECIADCQ